MKQHVITCFLFFLSAALTPAFTATRICTLSPQVSTNPASFKFNDPVNIDFSYETDEAGGIRVFIRPFSSGSLTPGYSASGSPLYSGSGSDVANFTITGSTPVVVDELRVQVYNADQSVLIQEFFVPVKFYFDANAVKDITFTAGATSGSYLHGSNVSLSFNYDISQAGGARIFFRPFSGGSLTPGYSASGSPLFSGAGAGSANFTIMSGANVTVDAIRVQILTADQATVLKEFFIPVYQKFSSVAVKDIVDPGSIYFNNNQDVDFSFNYETTEAGGVRIFFRPFSDGALTANYAAAGSPLYPVGNGSGTTNFTVTSGNTIVDQSRIQVYNSDQTQLLLEYFIPADYVTGAFDFYSFQSCAPSPARLANGTHIDMSFYYNNITGGDARLFIRPFTAGALSPGYAASGSPLYAQGSGTGTGNFTITSGDVVVDNLRVQVLDAAQTTTLMEFFLPVHYVFGAAVTEVESLPESIEAFSIAPNPATGAATLSVRSAAAQELVVEIFDLVGQRVQTPGILPAAAGQDQSLALDGATLPNGIYLVRLNGPGVQAVRKWVVSK